jgi:hypothetical protein
MNSEPTGNGHRLTPQEVSVDQLTTLIQIAAASALVAAPMVALVKLIESGINLEDGLPIRYAEPGWPAGVQEDDVPRFRVERARPRPASAATVEPPRPATATRAPQGCELAPTS